MSSDNQRLYAVLKTFSLVAFIIAAVMLPVIAGTADLSLHLISLTFMFASGALWLLTSIGEKKIALPSRGILIAGGAVVVAGLISAVLSDCPQAAIVTWIQWFGYISAFAVAFSAGLIPHVRSRIIRALCALALPIAIYAMLQQAFFMDATLKELKNKKDEVVQAQGLSEQDYQALVVRASSKRAPSTFAIPNSLAAFLIILLPSVIALAASAAGKRKKIILSGAAILIAGGLFVTYSKGGWLAGAAAVTAFLLLCGVKALKSHRKTVIAVSVATALLLVAIISIPSARNQLSGMPRDLVNSIFTRSDYWAASIKMWKDNPAFGAGPGNFQNHYLKYKSAVAEETKAAHNDYLQLLAEAGPAAMIGYALFFGILITLAVKKLRYDRGSEPPQTDSTGKDAVLIAGVGGIVIAAFTGLPFYISQNSLINFSAPIIFIALWYLIYRLSVSVNQRLLSAGLVFGLLGFALHSLVDLNLYTDGVAIIAFAVAGLLAADVAPGKVLATGRKGVVALLILIPLALGVFFISSRVSTSTAMRTYGVALARQGEGIKALEQFDEAISRNPLDHENYAAKGDLLATAGGTEMIEQAIEAWRKAVELNPSFADYHWHLAKALSKAAKSNIQAARKYIDIYKNYYIEIKLPDPAISEYIPAISEAARAVELAPNQPHYRMLLGETQLSAGLRTEGVRELKMALEINEKMKAAGTPFRQHLTRDQVQSIQKKLSLTLE